MVDDDVDSVCVCLQPSQEGETTIECIANDGPIGLSQTNDFCGNNYVYFGMCIG